MIVQHSILWIVKIFTIISYLDWETSSATALYLKVEKYFGYEYSVGMMMTLL